MMLGRCLASFRSEIGPMGSLRRFCFPREFSSGSNEGQTLHDSILAKSLRRFTKKVHPDSLPPIYPEKKATNQESLQSLNSFLQLLSSYSSNMASFTPQNAPPPFQIKFYFPVSGPDGLLREEPQKRRFGPLARKEEQRLRIQQSKIVDGFKLVSVNLQLPLVTKDVWLLTRKHQDLQLNMEHFRDVSLLSLLLASEDKEILPDQFLIAQMQERAKATGINLPEPYSVVIHTKEEETQQQTAVEKERKKREKGDYVKKFDQSAENLQKVARRSIYSELRTAYKKPSDTSPFQKIHRRKFSLSGWLQLSSSLPLFTSLPSV